jgi:hypothetical protein
MGIAGRDNSAVFKKRPRTSWPWLGSAAIYIVGCLEFGSAFGLTLEALRHGGGPIVLSPAQLDSVTAAGTTVTIDVWSVAVGPMAVTHTAGASQIIQTRILRVNLAAGAFPRYLGEIAVDMTTATASAIAKGDTSADCFANIQVIANVFFSSVNAAKTVTPGSAVCSCSVLALSFGG